MRGTRFAARCRITLLCSAALLATGCVNLRSTSAPMYTQTDASQCTVRADTLIVMLPGVYSYPEEFVREGFVKAVQDRRIAADVVRVDAHLGYYEKNVFVERLRQDVIAPAKARLSRDLDLRHLAGRFRRTHLCAGTPGRHRRRGRARAVSRRTGCFR